MRLVMHAAAVAVVKYTGLGGIRADITGALKVHTKEARELAGAVAEKAMMGLVLEEDKGGCGGGGVSAVAVVVWQGKKYGGK